MQTEIRLIGFPYQARDNSFLVNFEVSDALKITANGYRFSLIFKKALWNASKQQCVYCGELIENHKSMNVDHFIPKSRGGEESIENYVCACGSCNSAKHNVDLEEFRFRLSINKSPLKGILSPTQARQLIAIGVVLPLEIKKFHFERILSEEATHE